MDIIAQIGELGGWAWVIGGIVLLAFELLIPGGYLLWLGVAGLITGASALFQPIPVPFQWALFGVLSIIAVIAWHAYTKNRPDIVGGDTLNKGTGRLVGHEGTLQEPVVNGQGRLPIGDTVWRVSSQTAEIPEGTRVRIVQADGATLKVEPIPNA